MLEIASLGLSSDGREPARTFIEKKYTRLSINNEEDERKEPAQEPVKEPAAETPWPTNGGPLGCLIGLLSGLLLGAFLATTLFAFDRLIGIPLTLVLSILLAIVGWKIGRSIFREYKPPKPRQRPSKG